MEQRREREVDQEVPPAAQEDLSEDSQSPYKSSAFLHYVPHPHAWIPNGPQAVCLPCAGLRRIQGRWATGLQLLGPRGLWVPGHSEAQVSPNWPFEASSPRPESREHLPSRVTLGCRSLHVAHMTDNVESQVTESIPCCASIKTQEFLQPEPGALRCPLLTPFPAQEARGRRGRGCSVPHHCHQHRPGSGVLSSPGAQGPG